MALATLLVVVAVYCAYALARSLPGTRLIDTPVARTVGGPPPALAWPGAGEAAVAVPGIGLLGVHDATRPVPIASVAKVMTAYLILADHPLAAGQSGPSLTVRRADVALYRHEAAIGESVLPVRAGERLTEREALEGLLLPSGNNVALMLARWDSGGEAAFVARMNATARTLGLTDTHYTDPSGYASSTVSTAADQLVLAAVADRLPVFRQIVAMPAVVLPYGGTQYNVDSLLGHDGIVGIKTGSTGLAGGCFVFAARIRVGGRTVTALGAVLGQQPTRTAPSLLTAVFAATHRLLATVRRALHVRTVLARSEPLATITSPWQRVSVVPAHPVRVVAWGGLPVTVVVSTTRSRLPSAARAGQTVATATVAIGAHRTRVPLVVSTAVSGPSFTWRLTHP